MLDPHIGSRLNRARNSCVAGPARPRRRGLPLQLLRLHILTAADLARNVRIFSSVSLLFHHFATAVSDGK